MVVRSAQNKGIPVVERAPRQIVNLMFCNACLTVSCATWKRNRSCWLGTLDADAIIWIGVITPLAHLQIDESALILE
jgi:hypothetical protein